MVEVTSALHNGHVAPGTFRSVTQSSHAHLCPQGKRRWVFGSERHMQHMVLSCQARFVSSSRAVSLARLAAAAPCALDESTPAFASSKKIIVSRKACPTRLAFERVGARTPMALSALTRGCNHLYVPEAATQLTRVTVTFFRAW